MVLFDLDGTLVDTAYDLGRALNLLLEKHGKPTLPHEKIRPVASHGTAALLHLGFGQFQDAQKFDALKAAYLDLYAEALKQQPVLLPQIELLLDALDAKNIAWGVVTNKPRRFSLPLLQVAMTQKGSLFERSACLVCADDVPNAKPAPDSLLLACKQTNVQPINCIYVGDAARDIEAGNKAGMKTVVALFGYLSEADQPETWGADYQIETPLGLLKFI
jgi:phosphoglycolate phosphatase